MKKKYPLIVEICLLLLTLIIVSILVSIGKIGWVGLTIAIPILYLSSVSIAIYIYITETNFETKTSWLIFLILIPIVGHITFLFLGRKTMISVSKLKYEENFMKFANNEINLTTRKENDVFKNKISATSKRKWKSSTFELEKHSFNSFYRLFEDLKNAKHHIHIEMYIIKPSEIYDEFKSILISKVEEGVKVKIIIDDFGKWAFSDGEILDLKESGIKILIFNKINFPFMNLKQSFRLHRKMIIIDGEIVHTGGMNISDEYASFDKKYGYWADVNARVTGEICNDFSQLFLFDWFTINNEKLSPTLYIKQQQNKNINSSSLLLDESPITSEYILEQSIVNCFNLSKKIIRIATPYFIPSKKIMDQLKFLLLEGVKVEIFVPGLADKKYILEATYLYLDELILAGAKAYKLKNIFLHSKIATFDNSYGYLGTVNLDMRAMYSNYESINFLSGEVVQEIDALFNDYINHSDLILPKIKKTRNPIQLFKIFLIKTLSPLM